jgi:hypothetical protein
MPTEPDPARQTWDAEVARLLAALGVEPRTRNFIVDGYYAAGVTPLEWAARLLLGHARRADEKLGDSPMLRRTPDEPGGGPP